MLHACSQLCSLLIITHQPHPPPPPQCHHHRWRALRLNLRVRLLLHTEQRCCVSAVLSSFMRVGSEDSVVSTRQRVVRGFLTLSWPALPCDSLEPAIACSAGEPDRGGFCRGGS